MNMKLFLVGLASATALSAPASAAVDIAGSISSISYNSADPGLAITATPLSPFSFTLNNVGDFVQFDVLKIGTPENTVNIGEDTTPYPISVTFAFTDPAGSLGAPVSGSTTGFIIPFTHCGILAGGCGSVNWGPASVFDFGHGGKFSVELLNTTFGTPGNSNVTGRFTLLSNSVPEPATWAMLIFGFGAIGATMRRRQTASVRYNFA